jgi:lipocalin
MIPKKDGFLKGDMVEFQDRNFCWRRGTVQHVEWAEMRAEGPGSRLVEKKPTQIHVRFLDPFKGGYRVIVLPKKRVRAVPAESA